MVKIHYTGQQGGAYGWGQFGANIVKELRAIGAYTEKDYEADVVFHVIANHELDQAPGNRGPINFGMTFFESPLGPRAAENAKKYDVLFVGSTWCKERCAERGITNTEVLIQGVDREIFKPRHNNHEPFRIFSGGKFEFRKGQDLVIAAFREFAKDHPEAHLVCSWFNPWPQIVRNTFENPAVQCRTDFPPRWFSEQQEKLFTALLMRNGIGLSRFTILPKLSQQQLAAEMANTDCGLFPNRCEGGTNLVLMEYAACGGLAVANIDTGHRDVRHLIGLEIKSYEDDARWSSQSVGDIVDGLERARNCKLGWTTQCIPTWQSAAKQILHRAQECLQAKSHDMGPSLV